MSDALEESRKEMERHLAKFKGSPFEMFESRIGVTVSEGEINPEIVQGIFYIVGPYALKLEMDLSRFFKGTIEKLEKLEKDNEQLKKDLAKTLALVDVLAGDDNK